MLISCIIPTCNRNEFLTEAVKSAIGQSRCPDEVIIVNNGTEPLDLPADLQNRVKIYDIVPFAGASQARNFGAAMANGEYLAFLDDDDLWSKDYLREVEKSINAGEKCIASRIDQLAGGEITLLKNPDEKLTVSNVLTHNPGGGGSNMVISKKLFYEVGGYDPKMITSEDRGLVMEILLKGYNIKTLPENRIIARKHGKPSLCSYGNLSLGNFEFLRKYRKYMDFRQRLANYRKIYNYQFKAGDKKAAVKYLFIKIIYFFIKNKN